MMRPGRLLPGPDFRHRPDGHHAARVAV